MSQLKKKDSNFGFVKRQGQNDYQSGVIDYIRQIDFEPISSSPEIIDYNIRQLITLFLILMREKFHLNSLAN